MWHVWENGICVGRPEGKKPLGRSWHRWEDNSRIDLQEVVWGGMDWMNVVRDRDRWLAIVNVVMNMQVSPVEGNFISWGSVSFWGRTRLHGISSWPVTTHLCRHNWQTMRDFTCVKIISFPVTRRTQVLHKRTSVRILTKSIDTATFQTVNIPQVTNN